MATIKKSGASFVIVVILVFVIFILKTGIVASQPIDEDNLNINNMTRQSVPFVDPRVLEQFNISSEIPVIVKVRDVSGISVSSNDSIEQHKPDNSAKSGKRFRFCPI